MSQKLPVNDFNQVEETSEFKEDFIKIDNEDSDIGHFIEVDVQCPIYITLTIIYPFYLKE